MIATIIGGTNPASLRSNFSKEARAGSRSKRLITTEAWPPFRVVVWATGLVVSPVILSYCWRLSYLVRKLRETSVDKEDDVSIYELRFYIVSYGVDNLLYTVSVQPHTQEYVAR